MPWNDTQQCKINKEVRTSVTIHWKHDSSNVATDPTTYHNIISSNVSEGCLAVEYEVGKVIIVPLQNIWHLNYETKEATE